MKLTIGIIFVIGIALLGLGKWQGDHDTNPDNEASAFVMIAGAIVLAGDVALTIGYALYRLFTS